MVIFLNALYGGILMDEIIIESPVKGELIPLKEVNDPAFAEEILGKGAAVKNPEGKVIAPFDGELAVFFDTKHALVIKSKKNGLELLVHVGIDTVKLQGKYFTAHKEQGEEVKKGDLLLTFDEPAIAANYDTVTTLVITNHEEFEDITITLDEAKIKVKGSDNEGTLDKIAKGIEKLLD